MRIAAWVWQLQNDYPGVDSDDAKLPIDEMWVKAADGMWPQGQFDNHPLEVSGLAAARVIRDIYTRQGINMIPWVVPHGVWPGIGPGGGAGEGYAFEEGKMHGQYAAAAKDATGNDRAILIVDLEPSYYGGTGNPQFWRDDLGAGVRQVNLYLSGAAAGGAQEVWLSSVWRANPQALRDVTIDAWLANRLVTELHPQVYWTDFRKSWQAALAEFDTARSLIADRLGAHRTIRPTMPGNATVTDIMAFIGECQTRGYARPSIWRRGTVSRAVWTAIERAPWAEAQRPSSPVVVVDNALAALEAAARAVDLVRTNIETARVELGGGAE